MDKYQGYIDRALLFAEGIKPPELIVTLSGTEYFLFQKPDGEPGFIAVNARACRSVLGSRLAADLRKS